MDISVRFLKSVILQLFFIFFSIVSYIILKEFRFKLAAFGTFLMSLVYFLEGFEEFIFFSEGGLVDYLEDFFC